MTIKNTTAILVLIGALNWGLIGLFNFNLVSMIFGEMTVLTRIIYSLVGISAVYQAVIYSRGGRTRGDVQHPEQWKKAA